MPRSCPQELPTCSAGIPLQKVVPFSSYSVCKNPELIKCPKQASLIPGFGEGWEHEILLVLHLLRGEKKELFAFCCFYSGTFRSWIQPRFAWITL